MANTVKVDGDALGNVAIRTAQVENAIQESYAAANYVRNGLNWEVRNKACVDADLRSLCTRLQRQKNKLESMSSVAAAAAEEAGIQNESIAKQVSEIVLAIGAVTTVSTSTALSGNVFKKIWDWIKSIIPITPPDPITDKSTDADNTQTDTNNTNNNESTSSDETSTQSPIEPVEDTPASSTKTVSTTYGEADVWQVSAYRNKDSKPPFDESIWPSASEYTGSGCAVASVATAFSTIGLKVTPKQVWEANGNKVGASWNYAKLGARVDSQKNASTEDLDEMIKKYQENPGKYSAPIINFDYYRKNKEREYEKCPHFVVVIGKNADGSYQIVDSGGKNITRFKYTTVDSANGETVEQMWRVEEENGVKTYFANMSGDRSVRQLIKN